MCRSAEIRMKNDLICDAIFLLCIHRNMYDGFPQKSITKCDCNIKLRSTITAFFSPRPSRSHSLLLHQFSIIFPVPARVCVCNSMLCIERTSFWSARNASAFTLAANGSHLYKYICSYIFFEVHFPI